MSMDDTDNSAPAPIIPSSGMQSPSVVNDMVNSAQPTAQPSQPAPAPAPPEPGVWHRILTGALEGLQGGGPMGALTRGLSDISPTMYDRNETAIKQHQQIAQEKVNQAQNTTAEGKLKLGAISAQTAASLADAAVSNANANAMPQKAADAHEELQRQGLQSWLDRGATVTMASDDDHDSVVNALNGQAQNGGVNHSLYYNVGGQHFALDISQLANGPAGTSAINDARIAQGLPPVSGATIAQENRKNGAAVNQLLEQSAKFFAPDAPKDVQAARAQVSRYEGYLAAMKKTNSQDPASQRVQAQLEKVVAESTKIRDDMVAGKSQDLAQKNQSALDLNQGKINQKNAQTPQWKPGATADEKKKAELAENIAENANQVATILKAHPELVGTVNGTMTSVQQMMGTKNDNISKMGIAIHNIAMANSGVHGFRANEGVKDTEQLLLQHFRNGARGIGGALKGLTTSTQTFIDNARPEGYKTHSKSGGALQGMNQ